MTTPFPTNWRATAARARRYDPAPEVRRRPLPRGRVLSDRAYGWLQIIVGAGCLIGSAVLAVWAASGLHP